MDLLFDNFRDSWVILAIALFTTIVFAQFIMPHLSRILEEPDKEKEDIRKKLRQNISEKIKSNLDLSVADIINIGRGLGASRSISIRDRLRVVGRG